MKAIGKGDDRDRAAQQAEENSSSPQEHDDLLKEDAWH